MAARKAAKMARKAASRRRPRRTGATEPGRGATTPASGAHCRVLIGDRELGFCQVSRLQLADAAAAETPGGAQGNGGPGTVVGGFTEVSGLGTSVDYAEYRNGNEKTLTPRKVPGLTKVQDVILKRSVIGSLDLFEWLRTGSQGTPDPRAVTITLLDGERQPVATWRLRRAQPSAWLGPTLRAQQGALAIEERRFVCEGLDME